MAGELGRGSRKRSATAKFALRGLAPVMARDLAPQCVHVAYINVDGAIDMPFIAAPPSPEGPPASVRAQPAGPYRNITGRGRIMSLKALPPL